MAILSGLKTLNFHQIQVVKKSVSGNILGRFDRSINMVAPPHIEYSSSFCKDLFILLYLDWNFNLPMANDETAALKVHTYGHLFTLT